MTGMPFDQTARGQRIAAEKKLRSMGEGEFLRNVCHLLKLGGWRYTHSRPAIDRSGRWSTPIQGDRGFPDIFAVHERRELAIAIELKTDTGKTSTHQDEWLAALTTAGIHAAVWRPKQIDEIAKFLVQHSPFQA